jgi:hypothetical protein
MTNETTTHELTIEHARDLLDIDSITSQKIIMRIEGKSGGFVRMPFDHQGQWMLKAAETLKVKDFYWLKDKASRYLWELTGRMDFVGQPTHGRTSLLKIILEALLRCWQVELQVTQQEIGQNFVNLGSKESLLQEQAKSWMIAAEKVIERLEEPEPVTTGATAPAPVKEPDATGAPVIPDKTFVEQVAENLKGAAVQQAPATAVKGAEKTASGMDDMSLEARAVAVLTENPTWNQTRIAKTIGCTRQSLYNMQEYQRVRGVLKASRQTRKKSGTLGKIGSHTDIEDDDNDGD